MGLQERLFEDMKSAMKSGDKVTLETLRMLRSQIKNASISKGGDLSDDDVTGVLSKEAKRRKESIDLYTEGNRKDLVQQETKELEIITSYLPEMMSKEELLKMVDRTIRETGAESIKDMGKVMGAVMPQIKGRADGKAVQEIVRGRLS